MVGGEFLPFLQQWDRPALDARPSAATGYVIDAVGREKLRFSTLPAARTTLNRTF